MKRLLIRTVQVGFALLIFASILFPIAWMVMAGFKGKTQVLRPPFHIIPGVASSFSMFFLRQFYLSYPAATEEAALIDGASRFQIFLRIFLPQSKAPFVVMGTVSFLAYWNSYIWPVLTITNPNLTQIMQVLGNFRSDRGNDWGLLMAGSTIAAMPTVALLLIFQRYIVNGVRIAGMK